jgi:hypothetical protein
MPQKLVEGASAVSMVIPLTKPAPVRVDARAAGKTSLRATAAELTGRRIRTRRGGQWNVETSAAPQPTSSTEAKWSFCSGILEQVSME